MYDILWRIIDMLDWLAGQPRWSRRHEEAWSRVQSRDEQGLTAFQKNCEQALLDAMSGAGFELEDRNVACVTLNGNPLDDRFITWAVKDAAVRIGIYEDGADIRGPKGDDRFEEWDALTPAALIEMVCERAVTRARECKG